MPIEVRLPQAGMAMQQGTVLEWLKQPGDPVSEGEVIAEVENEKSVMEVVAPASGILASIQVQVGESVPPRTVLAVLAAPGEDLDSIQPQNVPPASDTRSAGGGPPPVPAPPLPAPQQSSPQAPRGRVQITPAARRLATESSLDLGSVQGTGPGGRVTEEDVRRTLDARTEAPPDAIAATILESVPLEGVRGRIAQRMLASLHSTAQFTLTTKADVTNLVTRRNEAKADLPLTYTHLVLRACAFALREHPRLNAIVDGDQMHVLADINIGIAVAMEEGLVVPVLRNVDELSLQQIVERSDSAVSRARAKRASADDVTGGTFTVSSLGSYGVDAFTPILNPPEVAILGVGRITQEPSQNGANEVTWRNMMTLSLTVDHRAIDGVPAAEFLRTVAANLETPNKLFSAAPRS